MWAIEALVVESVAGFVEIRQERIDEITFVITRFRRVVARPNPSKTDAN